MPNPYDYAFPRANAGASQPGINIRTYIATQAMAGILHGDDLSWGASTTQEAIAKAAVNMADALIRRLNG